MLRTGFDDRLAFLVNFLALWNFLKDLNIADRRLLFPKLLVIGHTSLSFLLKMISLDFIFFFIHAFYSLFRADGYDGLLLDCGTGLPFIFLEEGIHDCFLF